MRPDTPKPATPEARALLNAAERDWKTVEILSQHAEAPLSSICFHAQQYVEKVMKAVLVSNSIIFRRTHDLQELAALLEQMGIAAPLPLAGSRSCNSLKRQDAKAPRRRDPGE